MATSTTDDDNDDEEENLEVTSSFSPTLPHPTHPLLEDTYEREHCLDHILVVVLVRYQLPNLQNYLHSVQH
jgi:hypothetical protein